MFGRVQPSMMRRLGLVDDCFALICQRSSANIGRSSGSQAACTI
ncbi:hypothetical protein GQ600_25629 [Phytophthora cactorum]|nr:hypothetical protein GQ600_25629 [Phytophthora cactorum]